VLIKTYLKTVKKCNHEYLNKVTTQPGTDARVRMFSAGLLTRSQFCIRKVLRPANSIKVFRVFLGPRANAELVPKFHVALHASHAALPMVISKIFRPNAAP
jgi:hypothetical protein